MMPSSKPNAPSMAKQKDMFRNMTATQASGQRSTISVHNAAAKVYTDHLVLTHEQKSQITVLYETPGQIHDTMYRWNGEGDQAAAAAELTAHRLDASSREALDSRWSVHWTNSERKGKKEIKRILYQWYVSL
jgi:hypothetical protein